jgi:hypothetical protein
MTTVALSDGTKVPQRYDFNEHFEPLTVKMQGNQGICWWETRCTMLEAFWRMYTDTAPTFDPHQLSNSTQSWDTNIWGDERFDPVRPLGTTHYIGGDKVTNLPGYKELPPAEAIAKALWTNGILEGGTKAQQSMDRLYLHPGKYGELNKHGQLKRLPTLHVLPGDLEAVAKNTWAHAVIFVGYRLILDPTRIDKVDGIEVLFQNSWSSRFGKAGRAYLGWDMVQQDVCDPGFIHTFNDHPADALRMPAKR